MGEICLSWSLSWYLESMNKACLFVFVFLCCSWLPVTFGLGYPGIPIAHGGVDVWS